MEQKYRLQTSPFETNSPWSPRVDLPCGRISVVLGSNGVGKTELLRQIVHTIVTTSSTQPAKYLQIEGARNVTSELLSVQASLEQDTPAKAIAHYKGRRGGTLAQRVKSSLVLLKKRSEEQRIDFADKVTQWYRTDRTAPIPQEEELSWNKSIRLFQEIFPEITVEVTVSDQIYLNQGGNPPYPITSASEGERQVFALIADIVLNTDEKDFTVVVDEPEAHLNALLANQVWDTIEQNLPYAQFIYCSHSVAFAERDNVAGSIFFLGKNSPEVRCIDSIFDLSPEDRTELLGSLPAIASSKQSLFVEGTDTSFDLPFYNWVIGPSKIKIIPVGPKSVIEKSLRRIEHFAAIVPDCKIVGVVDRDDRSDKMLASMTATQIIVLPLNEAESFLCIPTVFADLLKVAEGIDVNPSDIEAFIREHAKSNAEKVKVQRLLYDLNLAQDMHLSYAGLSAAAPNQQTLLETLSVEITEKAENIRQMVTTGLIEAQVEHTFSSIELALTDAQIAKILVAWPGKQMFSALVQNFGSTPDRMLEHLPSLDANKYSDIVNLREVIKSKFK